MHTKCPAHLFILDMVTLIKGLLNEEYKIMKLLILNFSPDPRHFIPLGFKQRPVLKQSLCYEDNKSSGILRRVVS
jgi:hypothetical protein